MSETTETPAVNARLYKALSALQAELPQVAKGETALVPGKEGKRGYEYKYADLASISATVMPVLGRHGLAFFSKPTLVNGQFVLAYSLVHESGEREDGIYPIASQGTPQQIGGLITYARRYALCAVTGVAPGGDDDDAQSANVTQRYDSQSAAEAFQNATPARELAPAEPDEALVADWQVKIDGITTRGEAGEVDTELREVFKNGRMDTTTANAIRDGIRKKAASLPPAQPMNQGPRDETGAPDEATAEFMSRALDAATADDLRAIRDSARKARKASSAFMYEGRAITLNQFIEARIAEVSANGHDLAGSPR